ncbi:protein SCO1 homolog 2, mitochondrial isoform X1 [Primulina huaijiensis]|uniref:protein SCO1 homolog 2, mitochondrial isoform X1 n=1 Tax=Primulina huaijiensis TaxID=1492673 RepID=UPI003CC74121
MPLSKFVFSSLRNCSRPSLPNFRRFGQSNLSLHSLTKQTITRDSEILGCFKKYFSSFQIFIKFDQSRRHCSSSTRSTSRTNSPLPLPEQTVSPTSRTPFVFVTVLAGIGGLVFFIHNNDEKRAVPKGKGEKFERSAISGPIIGGPFSLINTERQLVTEQNLLGNWVLLYFGYTSSPDVGPAEVQKMAKSIDILESEQNLKVLPIFVTIDPRRDTPSQLRAYIREFDSRIVGLTGPVASIRQMAQEYRVFFRKVDDEGDDYLVESSHNMYLVNQSMLVVRSFGVEYSPDELVKAIADEMKRTPK